MSVSEWSRVVDLKEVSERRDKYEMKAEGEKVKRSVATSLL